MDRPLATVCALLLVVTACGTESDVADTAEGSGVTVEPTSADDPGAAEELYPDVVGVEAVHDGDGSWTFDVTLSSPYDSAERYADAWRVVGPDGTVYGERLLLHDHAAEQPFTRSLTGVEIPADVDVVTIQGRDLVNGYGGGDAMVAVPGR